MQKRMQGHNTAEIPVQTAERHPGVQLNRNSALRQISVMVRGRRGPRAPEQDGRAPGPRRDDVAEQLRND